jgi:hypothetical protein
MALHILQNLFWQRAEHFLSMSSGLLESVTVTEFQAINAYSSLHLTKEKYRIYRLSVAKKKNSIIRISPNNLIAYENNQQDNEN